MEANYDGYLGVFLALVLSTTVLPVPEELPVITAGVLCGHSDTEYANERDNPSRLRWWIMLPVVILGAVIGDVVLYAIGRIWGKRLLDLAWVKRRLLSPEQRDKIEKNFAKHGVAVLLGVRLLPGIRGWVFLIAGSVRLPFWQFLVADAIYAIPIVNLMFWTAYWFTDQIMVVIRQIDAYRPLVISHLIAAVAGALIYKYLLARHVPTGETPRVPSIISKPAGAIGHAFESAVDVVIGRHNEQQKLEQLHNELEQPKNLGTPPPGNEPPPGTTLG